MCLILKMCVYQKKKDGSTGLRAPRRVSLTGSLHRTEGDLEAVSVTGGPRQAWNTDEEGEAESDQVRKVLSEVIGSDNEN